MQLIKLFIIFLIIVPAFLQTLYAEEKPLWEAGFGLTTIQLPNYKGSSETGAILLPFPYIVYRGENFRMDKEGIRGKLFNTDRITLEVSINASPPVDSSDSILREGMPDLDPTFEFGPRLKVLIHELSGTGKVTLEFPFRGVFSTDFTRLDHEGWIFHPNLNIDLPHLYRDWNLGLKLGPMFADKQYHDYFYGVDSSYTTPQRTQFETKNGYSGTTFIAGISKRYSRHWIGAFVRYDNLAGADFTTSPLVDDNDSVMAGVGFAWVFAKSSKMIE